MTNLLLLQSMMMWKRELLDLFHVKNTMYLLRLKFPPNCFFTFKKALKSWKVPMLQSVACTTYNRLWCKRIVRPFFRFFPSIKDQLRLIIICLKADLSRPHPLCCSPKTWERNSDTTQLIIKLQSWKITFATFLLWIKISEAKIEFDCHENFLANWKKMSECLFSAENSQNFSANLPTT